MQSSKSYVIITTEAEGFAEHICDLNKIVDFRYYAPNTSLRGIKQMLYTQVRTNKNFFREKDFKMASKAKKTTALLLASLMCAGAFAGCGGNGGTTTSTAGGTESTAASGDASTASSAGEASIPTVAEITERLKTEAKDGKISLKVWAPNNSKDFIKSMVEKFKTTYAVDGVTYDIKVVEKGEDKCINSLTEDASKGADVFQFPTDQLLTGINAGVLAEVPTVFQGQISSENMEDAVKSCTYENKVYAYPMTSDNGYFLYYNSSKFTADDVKSFETLLAKAKDQKVQVLMPIDNAWYNASFFYAAGCDIKLDTATQKMDLVDFDTDKGVAATKAMADLVNNNKDSFVSSGDDAAISTLLSSGKLQAVVTGTWNTPVIENAWGKENVSATKLPTVKMNGTDTQLHSFGGYKLVGVNSASKFPLASATLATYLTGAEVQQERYNQLQVIPTNNEILATDALKNDPIQKAIEAQRPYSHSQSVCTQKFWDPVASVGSDINNGNLKSSDEAGIKAALQKVVNSVENG